MPRNSLLTACNLFLVSYPIIIILFLTTIYFSILSGSSFTTNPNYFLLDPETPNIFSMYLAHFTHYSWDHYSNNVIGFIVYFMMCVIISNNTVDKKTTIITSLLLLLIIPFSISSILLLLPQGIITIGHGYSALTLGFLGLLLILLQYHILLKLKKFEYTKLITLNMIVLLIFLFLFIICDQLTNTPVGTTAAHITGFFYGYSAALLIHTYYLSEKRKKLITTALICLLFVPIICFTVKYTLMMVGFP